MKVRSLEERARQAEPVLRIAEWARQNGRSVESSISGRSMGETLAEGTTITIDLTNRDYEKGAVVAMLSGAAVCAHRVIGRGWTARSRRYWITRGDALAICDAPVDESLVVGRVFLRDGESLVPPPAEPPRPLSARAVIALVMFALALDVRLARTLTRVLSTIASLGRRQASGTP